LKKSRHRWFKLIILVLLLYAAVLNVPNIIKFFYPLKYNAAIIEYSNKYNIDPPLLAALIKAESNFEPLAESKKGARGLMQITPSTGRWIAEKICLKEYEDNMLFDPVTNISMGSWYINYLRSYYNGSLELVLAAYNGGSGNVDKWLRDKSLSSDGKTLDAVPFKETENFIIRVEKNYSIYKKIYKWSS
jgi:soluble lytic murein transglycosylase